MTSKKGNVAAEPTFLEEFDRRFTDYSSDQIPDMSEKLYTCILELYTDSKEVPMNIFEMGRFAMDNFRMRTSFAIACIRRMEEEHRDELETMGYRPMKGKIL